MSDERPPSSSNRLQHDVGEGVKITPQSKNANKHSPRGMGALEQSIGSDGWIGAITTAANGETFDGSARDEVAEANGFALNHEEPLIIEAPDDRPVYVRSKGRQPVVHIRSDIPNADDPRAVRLGIAANRVAELNLSWDADILSGLDIDLPSSLFTTDELSELLEETQVEAGGGGDEFDATPEEGETRTKTGDLWLIGGKHRLVVGDCTDPATVSLLMGGERAALCFTSPPYSDQRQYDGDSDLSPLHLAQFITAAADFCDLYAVNLGISRKDNEIQTYWDVYIEAAQAAGLKLLSWNVWDQGSVGSVGKITAMFPIEHEFIFIFGERRVDLNLTVPNKTGGIRNNHVADRQAAGHVQAKRDVFIRDHRPIGTVARCAPFEARNVDTSHPAMFPIELPTMYLEACTDKNDIAYDPFFGSGSLLIAAHRTGRRCYGVEISPRYADVILRRAEAEGLTVELLTL